VPPHTLAAPTHCTRSHQAPRAKGGLCSSRRALTSEEPRPTTTTKRPTRGSVLPPRWSGTRDKERQLPQVAPVVGPAVAAAARNGARVPAAYAAPHPRPDDPNHQATSSLAQRIPARSTGGNRPSGTDMNRVAAARTTGCYRKSVPVNHQAHRLEPHPHTRAPEPLAGGTGFLLLAVYNLRL
jgi:hypothetical protein